MNLPAWNHGSIQMGTAGSESKLFKLPSCVRRADVGPAHCAPTRDYTPQKPQESGSDLAWVAPTPEPGWLQVGKPGSKPEHRDTALKAAQQPRAVAGWNCPVAAFQVKFQARPSRTADSGTLPVCPWPANSLQAGLLLGMSRAQ